MIFKYSKWVFKQTSLQTKIFQFQKYKRKYVDLRPIGLIEPNINLKSENSIQISLRFNKFTKTCGLGLGFQSLTKQIHHSLGYATRQRNQWIEEAILSSDKQSINSYPGSKSSSFIQNQPQLSYGGIYIIHEKGQDKSTIILSDRFFSVPITWNEKDNIILEYNPIKNLMKIQVVNCINFETKSFKFQFDRQSILGKEEQESNQPFHFLFILDQLGDHIEILGDPEANHIKQKTPPQIQNVHFYDLAQKYFIDKSCCSPRIRYENKTMDCVIVQTDNKYLQNISSSTERLNYMFTYFKPCLPFPNEKLYIKRIAFMIENIGEGELFIGITRENFAIYNIGIDTSRPDEDWNGLSMLFGNVGIDTIIKQQQIKKFKASYINGQIVIIEYNPFSDSLTMINSKNQQNIITNLYSDFTEQEFEDKQNRYCFCVGGASGFKVILLNDYFDDIQDYIML